MKQYLRPLGLVLALVLLAGGAYAASAGDSLISLKYLQDTFFPRAVQAGEEKAGTMLQDTYDKAKGQLDAIHGAQPPEGGTAGNYSGTLERRLWTDGQTITLTTGDAFLLLEGAAAVTHNGAVVDVTAGTETASGAKLAVNHRYLVGEDTAAEVVIRSGQAALGLQGGYTLFDGKARHTPFFDVSQFDWFYSQVGDAYERGLFSGVDAGHFSPGGTMDRAMLMTVLHRLAGSPAQTGGVAFSDVPEGLWYTQAVHWGYAQGITSGTGGSTFSPNGRITREQAVVMLYNYAGQYLKLDVSRQADLSAYGDAGKVSGWARSAMAWAVGQGVINGASNGGVLSLEPQRGATRAEMAAMLCSFCEKIL